MSNEARVTLSLEEGMEREHRVQEDPRRSRSRPPMGRTCGRLGLREVRSRDILGLP